MPGVCLALHEKSMSLSWLPLSPYSVFTFISILWRMSCLFAYSHVSSQSTRLVGWILTLIAFPIQLHPQCVAWVAISILQIHATKELSFNETLLILYNNSKDFLGGINPVDSWALHIKAFLLSTSQVSTSAARTWVLRLEKVATTSGSGFQQEMRRWLATSSHLGHTLLITSHTSHTLILNTSHTPWVTDWILPLTQVLPIMGHMATQLLTKVSSCVVVSLLSQPGCWDNIHRIGLKTIRPQVKLHWK